MIFSLSPFVMLFAITSLLYCSHIAGGKYPLKPIVAVRSSNGCAPVLSEPFWAWNPQKPDGRSAPLHGGFRGLGQGLGQAILKTKLTNH